MDAEPQRHLAPAYTLVLVGCGVAALAWKLLAALSSFSSLPFADAVFALGGACWFAAFLRFIRSPAAGLATGAVSIALAFWFPLGTGVFLYWFSRVRPLESRSAAGPTRPSR